MAPEDGGWRVNIEPFDPDRHDRSSFSCGVARLDNYLNRTVRKHQEGNFTRLFVALAPGEQAVLGYYSLNAHMIEAENLPSGLTKNAPRHGAVPAAYLSMIAVDTSAQGQGLGTVLLADALKRLIPLSDEIGLAVVVLDVIDDGGEAAFRRRAKFYKSMGFIALPSRPARMFLPMKDVRKAFGR